MHRRVLKLGGSLLDLPELGPRLAGWLDCQPPAANLMLVGGGPVVEALRTLDQVHRFDAAWLHWQCLRALDLTAALAARLIPAARPLPPGAALDTLVAGPQVYLLSAETFLRDDARRFPAAALPAGWDVTSDSIAARVAFRWPADELVLLKSALPPAGSDLAALAANGYVDPHFPCAAEGLPRLRCVHLRRTETPGVDVPLPGSVPPPAAGIGRPSW